MGTLTVKKILLAGATGYLGSYVAKRLMQSDYELRLINRSPKRLAERGLEVTDSLQVEITRPETLKGCCDGIDTVLSTVGITR
jgi:uncharacterized protein YbjT (DUF2867 family)